MNLETEGLYEISSEFSSPPRPRQVLARRMWDEYVI